MFAEQKFFVGIQDCGEGRVIKNRALLENMSDTATVHSNLVGETWEKLAESHLAWVVTNWKLEVFKRVHYATTITVRTWSRSYNPAFANRDFEVYDAEGMLIAKATSVWMILNTARSFPQRLTPALMDPFQSEPDKASFPDFKFKNEDISALTSLKATFFTVTKSMIDCNNHVHNSAYLDLASEALPEDVNEQSFCNVEISYKKEIKPAQRVCLDYAKSDEASYVLIHSEDRSVLHTVIKLY